MTSDGQASVARQRQPGPAAGRDELFPRAVELAAEWVQTHRRLDMQRLATELGVSRVTLFRRAGGREELLGRALWLLTERTWKAAEREWEAERPPGAARCPAVMRSFNTRVSTASGLRRLLDDEPAVAIRVLTDPLGRVQPGVVAAVEALLRRDEQEDLLTPVAEPGALAYALVRLGESFLYADVLANRQPDVETANRLQAALMDSGTRATPA